MVNIIKGINEIIKKTGKKETTYEKKENIKIFSSYWY